ncbi:MAG: DMT family transporter [Chitinophagaceae bacterium]
MEDAVLKNRVTLAGFSITLLGAILFSTKAIIVKLAFAATSVNALTLLTLRMVFSLPFYVGAAILVSRSEQNIPLTKRQWVLVLITGLLGYYVSSYLDFWGLEFISAGLERLILFLYPTFAVLLNSFLFRQKIEKNQKVALLLTYFGIGLAFWGELNLEVQTAQFYLGSFLVFLCAITYSLYIVGSGRLIPQTGATKYTAYAMLSATAGIFIHFAIKGNYAVLHQQGSVWWYGLVLALVATVIPSFLISFGLKKIGSNNVAILSSIGPVSTIIQAHYFLGEKIFAEQIIGTVMVVIGVLLLGKKRAYK